MSSEDLEQIAATARAIGNVMGFGPPIELERAVASAVTGDEPVALVAEM